MRKHVRTILNHQRDILAPKAIAEIESAMQKVKDAIATKAEKAALEKQMENLEQGANKWLKPYPNAAWRENIEVLLVALTVALGIRTFFLQPFKIPTGSMQPTLFGVRSVPDFSHPFRSKQEMDEQVKIRDEMKIPSGLERVKQWFQGISYITLTAKEDGAFEGADEPVGFKIFNIYQKVHFGGETYTIWFPPDYGSPQHPPTQTDLEVRAGLGRGQFFHKGENFVNLQVTAGDHLFVNRLTYNFRPPERGEIVVFETHGIERLDVSQQNTFYIKRLVGLGGETLSLQQDYEMAGMLPHLGLVFLDGVPSLQNYEMPGMPPVGHLVVNGRSLTASTPHFENLYSFSSVAPGTKVLQYHENHYYGHALQGELAPGHDFQVCPDCFFVMGDNTMNSLDSRYWGDFPQTKVIGKSFFVYWPITGRFGLGYR